MHCRAVAEQSRGTGMHYLVSGEHAILSILTAGT